MKEEMEIYLTFMITICSTLIGYLIVQIIRGWRPYHEAIQFFAPKGTRKMLKGYAALKGFKNESQLINYLIQKEFQADKNKINDQ